MDNAISMDSTSPTAWMYGLLSAPNPKPKCLDQLNILSSSKLIYWYSNVLRMQDHWKTYITEEDFRFMSENGLNAVRIPVGWWIAKDPTPPKPFVGGSLKTLDNAFTWAQLMPYYTLVYFIYHRNLKFTLSTNCFNL